jgi:hypothetical protein
LILYGAKVELSGESDNSDPETASQPDDTIDENPSKRRSGPFGVEESNSKYLVNEEISRYFERYGCSLFISPVNATYIPQRSMVQFRK